MVTVSKMMEPIPYDGPETWEDMTGKQGMIKYFTNRINHEICEGKMFDRMLKKFRLYQFSELQDHYNALCKRCDARIDVCNVIIATADNPDTTARMRARIREEQHLKTGYEIFSYTRFFSGSLKR